MPKPLIPLCFLIVSSCSARQTDFEYFTGEHYENRSFERKFASNAVYKSFKYCDPSLNKFIFYFSCKSKALRRDLQVNFNYGLNFRASYGN